MVILLYQIDYSLSNDFANGTDLDIIFVLRAHYKAKIYTYFWNFKVLPEYSNIQDDYYDEFDDIYIDGKYFNLFSFNYDLLFISLYLTRLNSYRGPWFTKRRPSNQNRS